jgi:hypothetical protein
MVHDSNELHYMHLNSTNDLDRDAEFGFGDFSLGDTSEITSMI